jgi:hypothetical protein
MSAMGGKRTLVRDAHRMLGIAANEILNVTQSLWQRLSLGMASVAPKAETR